MVQISKPDEGLIIEVTVNGVQIKVAEEKLSALQILEFAEADGAIPGSPKDYLLQGDQHLYKPEDIVDLLENKEFIAIPNRPTQVA